MRASLCESRLSALIRTYPHLIALVWEKRNLRWGGGGQFEPQSEQTIAPINHQPFRMNSTFNDFNHFDGFNAVVGEP